MRSQFFKNKAEYALVGGETAEKERQLVRRLDRRLLVFAMLGYFLKVLDSSNLGSAYISGMEEELQVKGIEYNWMGVFFTLGKPTMQIPSNAILSRVRPSQYLPCLELLWCVLTFSMAGVRNVNDVYVIRVLLGLAEAGFYPGTVFLIGSWYTKAELGKRSSLFIMSGSLGGCWHVAGVFTQDDERNFGVERKRGGSDGRGFASVDEITRGSGYGHLLLSRLALALHFRRLHHHHPCRCRLLPASGLSNQYYLAFRRGTILSCTPIITIPLQTKHPNSLKPRILSPTQPGAGSRY
ncbi:major facilitator superfamily domain-containing protein [Endogone sp. FLAS-F59071]|nr:major facilitator superfamily domain-containing protein [Endogone sp. FLAS-F59071]|eukprot:RUS22361.1 major facilitator superfamily domain-containing protein [Endogone sp. FLAS-F59071]